MYAVTEESFSKAMAKGSHLLSRELRCLVDLHRQTLDDMIDPSRDAYLN